MAAAAHREDSLDAFGDVGPRHLLRAAALTGRSVSGAVASIPSCRQARVHAASRCCQSLSGTSQARRQAGPEPGQVTGHRLAVHDAVHGTAWQYAVPARAFLHGLQGGDPAFSYRLGRAAFRSAKSRTHRGLGTGGLRPPRIRRMCSYLASRHGRRASSGEASQALAQLSTVRSSGTLSPEAARWSVVAWHPARAVRAWYPGRCGRAGRVATARDDAVPCCRGHRLLRARHALATQTAGARRTSTTDRGHRTGALAFRPRTATDVAGRRP